MYFVHPVCARLRRCAGAIHLAAEPARGRHASGEWKRRLAPRRGLRIDTVLATDPLVEKLDTTGVDYEIRGMEKPSDHCPVWARFKR